MITRRAICIRAAQGNRAFWIRNFIKRLFSEERGATAIEYGLIAGLIAVVIIGALTVAGTGLRSVFETVSGELETVAGEGEAAAKLRPRPNQVHGVGGRLLPGAAGAAGVSAAKRLLDDLRELNYPVRDIRLVLERCRYAARRRSFHGALDAALRARSSDMVLDRSAALASRRRTTRSPE